MERVFPRWQKNSFRSKSWRDFQAIDKDIQLYIDLIKEARDFSVPGFFLLRDIQ